MSLIFDNYGFVIKYTVVLEGFFKKDFWLFYFKLLLRPDNTL